MICDLVLCSFLFVAFYFDAALSVNGVKLGVDCVLQLKASKLDDSLDHIVGQERARQVLRKGSKPLVCLV